MAPDVVETDMSNFTKTDAGRAVTLEMQALKRVAQADDIGGAVAFLARMLLAGLPAKRCMSTAVETLNP